jgi:hypothetical protein
MNAASRAPSAARPSAAASSRRAWAARLPRRVCSARTAGVKASPAKSRPMAMLLRDGGKGPASRTRAAAGAGTFAERVEKVNCRQVQATIAAQDSNGPTPAAAYPGGRGRWRRPCRAPVRARAAHPWRVRPPAGSAMPKSLAASWPHHARPKSAPLTPAQGAAGPVAGDCRGLRRSLEPDARRHRRLLRCHAMSATCRLLHRSVNLADAGVAAAGQRPSLDFHLARRLSCSWADVPCKCHRVAAKGTCLGRRPY